MVAIDLCCSDGLFRATLASISGRVYAVDINPVMVEHARLRVAIRAGRRTRAEFFSV